MSNGAGGRAPLPPRVAARLADLPRRYLALKHALSTFPDADDFVAAARSNDAQELARAYVLERAFEVVENSLAELARYGLIHAGLRDEARERPAREDFRALREERVISERQRKLLVGLQQRRSDLGHDYVEASAKATFEAARALQAALPDVIRAYRDWLGGLRPEDS